MKNNISVSDRRKLTTTATRAADQLDAGGKYTVVGQRKNAKGQEEMEADELLRGLLKEAAQRRRTQ